MGDKYHQKLLVDEELLNMAESDRNGIMRDDEESSPNGRGIPLRK